MPVELLCYLLPVVATADRLELPPPPELGAAAGREAEAA